MDRSKAVDILLIIEAVLIVILGAFNMVTLGQIITILIIIISVSLINFNYNTYLRYKLNKNGKNK